MIELKEKCPKCNSEETVTFNITHDDPYNPFLHETWTECKECGKTKHHWSYGTTFIENWVEVDFTKEELENDK